MKKTAAIVVTYNRKKLLKECLENLLKQDSKCDILLIDNCSTDGTYEELEKFIKENKIIYYNTGKNLGGAGGFNFGLRKALEKKYDYCWVMDDDTIVNKDSLTNLLEKAKELNDNFSFMGSVVKWVDGNLCNMNIQKVSSTAIKNYESLYNNLLNIDYCSFVSCFINAKCIKEVGLPITEFFIYGDDMEYTMRLSKIMPGYLNPYSIVTHKMGSNEGINIISCPEDRIERFFYNFRNLSYIYRKYDKKEYRLHKLKAHYLKFKILFKAKDNKIKRIRVISKGMRKGKKFNPEIEFV